LDPTHSKVASNEVLTPKFVKENDELSMWNKQLTMKLESLQMKLYAFQHQISEWTDQKEDLTTDLSKAKITAHGLRHELEEMKSILNSDASKTPHAVEGPQHDYEKKLISLKKDHEANKAALENLSISYRTLQTTHTKLQNLCTHLERSPCSKQT
jgi:DNA repair exonuclease SbcCD ATPase subunit